MNKIKKSLLLLIKKISEFLTDKNLHRLIPFRRKIYDFLFKSFWTGGDIIEIQGSKMYINPKEQDPMMRQTLQTYALSSTWEKETTKLFEKIVKEGDVIVDMGANVGYFTLLSAKLVGEKGKVFSFEPNPKNFEYLTKNIELNGYRNIITEQKAVSDRNGKTELFICPYDSGHHTINKADGIEAYRQGRKGKTYSIETETVRLDDYVRNRIEKIDVIKIDIEGAEALAFSGMKETLNKNKNIKIFLEFFPLLIEKMGNSPKEFIGLLLRDFNVFVIGHDYSMKKINQEFIKIENYKKINNLMEEKDDHLNLYIEKKS